MDKENKEPKTVLELLRQHLEEAIEKEANKKATEKANDDTLAHHQRFYTNEKGELVEDMTKHYPGYDTIVFVDDKKDKDLDR